VSLKTTASVRLSTYSDLLGFGVTTIDQERGVLYGMTMRIVGMSSLTPDYGWDAYIFTVDLAAGGAQLLCETFCGNMIHGDDNCPNALMWTP